MEKPKAEKFKTATIKTRIWTKVLVIEDKLERKLYEGMGEITSGFQPEIWGKYSFIRFEEGFVWNGFEAIGFNCVAPERTTAIIFKRWLKYPLMRTESLPVGGNVP